MFAICPLVPFLVLLVRVVAVRGHIFLNSDQASADVLVRRALHWHQELGPYDRYGWHHPGPSFFYLTATLERLLGSNHGAQAQTATVIAVNAACVVISVLVVGYRWGTRSAAAAAVSLTAVAAAMGHIALDSTWTTYLVIFPLILAGILAAVAIDGSVAALVGGAVAGSYAVQTDVATAALAVMFIVAGLVGCAVTWWKRKRPSRRDLQIAVPIGVLLVAMWVPSMIQEFSGSPGNLTAIWRFFTQNPQGRLGLLNGAVQVGNNTVSAFGVRSAPLQLAHEPGLRQLILVAGGGLIVLAAAIWARFWSAATVAALGVAGLGVAVYSAASIVGLPASYLTTWSAAPTVLLVLAAAMLAAALLPSPASATGTLGWPWRDVIIAALVVVAAAGLLARIATFPPLVSASDAPQMWRTVAPVVQRHPHERVGLVSTGFASARAVDGVADELDARGIPFSLPRSGRFALAPGDSARPQYWLYFSESVKAPLPSGYRRLGTVQQLVVSIGRTEPPHWNQPLNPNPVST